MSGRRVFLDVGAHVGETLSVVQEARWGFVAIHSFEPAPVCWPELDLLADARTTVHRFGLAPSDDRLVLHDPGTIGASTHGGKATTAEAVECDFRDAATWFDEHVVGADTVFMKINTEGAECDLLDRLLDANQLGKVDHLVVHFDVRKVPGMEHREAEVRRRLDAAGVAYASADDVFHGANVAEKTANWLAWCEATGLNRWRLGTLRRWEFAVRVPLYAARERAFGRAH